MDLGLVLALVAVAVAVAYVSFTVGSGTQTVRRSATRRLQDLQANRDVMQESLSSRLFLPAVHGLGALGLRFTPAEWAGRTRSRLIRAAWYPGIDETSWAAVRLVSLAVGVLAFFYFSRFTSPGLQTIALLIICLLGGYAGPDQVLNRRVAERTRRIERDLPDIIDLLVISIEAGMGFEAALGRVVTHVPGELSEEFGRMLQETRVGVSRHEAMLSLAERNDVDDLNSFVLAMNQADTFGVSVGRMLRVQADEMRVRRRQRAQERAFAAPVKMVFPLVFCIFPAIFVVLLGPAAINILTALSN